MMLIYQRTHSASHSPRDQQAARQHCLIQQQWLPTFMVDVSGAGDYLVQLIVNDGTVDSAPDTVTISAP